MKKAERSLSKAERKAIKNRAVADLMAPVKLERVHPALAFRIHKLWAEFVPDFALVEFTAHLQRREPSAPLDTIRLRASLRAHQEPGPDQIHAYEQWISLMEIQLADQPDRLIRSAIAIIRATILDSRLRSQS